MSGVSVLYVRICIGVSWMLNDVILFFAEKYIDIGVIKNEKVQEEKTTRDESVFVIGPTQLERNKKLIIEEKDDEEIYEDSTTIGSTSKDSSDWRSSIICRDSGTDDSSSRRSCPKWESYAVFQKYDEEMSFLERISAQKLHETGNIYTFRNFLIFHCSN